MVLRSDRRNGREANSSLLMMALREPIRSQDHPYRQLSARRVIFKAEGHLHYYTFNIGDYHTHTSHLSDLEDLAYRRMIDYCYLHECGLPESLDEIARLIRMRTQCDGIANVLREFFVLGDDGTYMQSRVADEIESYREKSRKAVQSASKRWKNKDIANNANAMRTHSERNAMAMLTNNHKPITNNHNISNGAVFRPPTLQEVTDYISTRTGNIDADRFVDFYTSKGWMVGKNKMKDWKAAVRNWEKGENGQVRQNGRGNTRGIETIDANKYLNSGDDIIG